MRSKLISIFAFSLLLVLAGCTAPPASGTQQGRAVFIVTDAAAEMGSVSSIQLTIDRVQVHSAAKGWVTVSSTPRTVDLLELKAQGKQLIIADSQLDTDTYTQVRLDVSNVQVRDADGTHEAKLPSNELKLVGELRVESNETTSARFDFIADESLHVTGNGKYILAPVIQFEIRENTVVTTDASGSAVITGGNIKTNSKVGMNARGEIGVNIRFPLDANVLIGGNGQIIILPFSAQTNTEGIIGIQS